MNTNQKSWASSYFPPYLPFLLPSLAILCTTDFIFLVFIIAAKIASWPPRIIKSVGWNSYLKVAVQPRIIFRCATLSHGKFWMYLMQIVSNTWQLFKIHFNFIPWPRFMSPHVLSAFLQQFSNEYLHDHLVFISFMFVQPPEIYKTLIRYLSKQTYGSHFFFFWEEVCILWHYLWGTSQLLFLTSPGSVVIISWRYHIIFH